MMSIYCEARNFAEKFIDPYSKKVDEEGVFPVEAFAEIKKSDFLTLLIPKEQGGLGLGIQEPISPESFCFLFSCSTMPVEL